MFKKIKTAIEAIEFYVGIIPNAYATVDEFYFRSQINALTKTLYMNKVLDEVRAPLAQVYIVRDDDTINTSSSLMDGIRINVDGAEYYVRCEAVRIPAVCIPFNGAQTLKVPVRITDEDGVEVIMNVAINVRLTAHKCLGESQETTHARLMKQFNNAHRALV